MLPVSAQGPGVLLGAAVHGPTCDECICCWLFLQERRGGPVLPLHRQILGAAQGPGLHQNELP